MSAALVEARKAFALNEVPVGCVIARDGKIIARAHNRREAEQDPTAHAEILAIAKAAKVIGSWRLEHCVLAVTLEPCAMCAGALVLARIPIVVFGATDPKAGACGTLYNIADDPRLNHRASVFGGVMANECGGILTEFFAEKRAEGKK